MHEIHGCSPACKTWGAIGVYGPLEVRAKSIPAMQLSHAFSWFLRFWPSIAWTRTCTPRVSECALRMHWVRARADALRALEQPTASLVYQYGANTGPVKPTCMGVFWTTHDSLRAQNCRKPTSESCTCSSYSHGLYDPVRVQKPSKNSIQTHNAVIRPIWSWFSLCA